MNLFLKCKKVSFATFLFLCLGFLLLVPQQMSYAVPSENRSLKYIYSFQNNDGGLKEELSEDSQSLETDWGIIATSANGYDSRTVGNPSLADFAFLDVCRLSNITDIERRTLALSSIGFDTRKLDGCNLIAQIQSFYDYETGMIGENLTSTVFGVLALSSANEVTEQKTINYILSSQQSDGGWDSGYGTESNFSAQTLMALKSAGTEIPQENIDKAKKYLKSLQLPSGGIRYDHNLWSTDSDAFSDSFVIQAIYAIGEDPKDEYWQYDHYTIFDDLESLRNEDGSYNYNREYGKMNPVWTTAVASIAYSGKYLPIAHVPLSEWQENLEIIVTPTDTVTPPSTALLSASQTPLITQTPMIEEYSGTVRVAFSSATVENTPQSFAPNNLSGTVISADKGKPETEYQDVLGGSSNILASNWKWLVLLAILSFASGALIKIIEIKYVSKIS